MVPHEVHTLDKRSAAPKRAQLDSLSRLKRGMRRKENPATSKNDGVARKLTAPADASILRYISSKLWKLPVPINNHHMKQLARELLKQTGIFTVLPLREHLFVAKADGSPH